MTARLPARVLPLLLGAALLVSAAAPLAADEPPSFSKFEAKSQNGRFVAVVEPADAKREKWKLTVFELVEKKSGTERVEKWSCPYRYSGYEGALVSDDGKSVVYLEVWFQADRSVIDFYREGKLVAQVKGADVAFDRSKTKKTVSHELWLLDGGATYGKSAEIDAEGRLVLRTIDGEVQRYDTATGAPVKE